MTRRNRNPRWITARYDGKCSQCGATIRKGDRAYYYPATRSILCGGACGEKGAADLRAERSMDSYGTDIMYDC